MSKPLNPPISLDDYATTFGHLCGQRVLQDIQEKCYIFDSMYLDGDDMMMLVAKEGARQIGLWLTEIVDAALNEPDAVPETSTEGVAEEDRNG